MALKGAWELWDGVGELWETLSCIWDVGWGVVAWVSCVNYVGKLWETLSWLWKYLLHFELANKNTWESKWTNLILFPRYILAPLNWQSSVWRTIVVVVAIAPAAKPLSSSPSLVEMGVLISGLKKTFGSVGTWTMWLQSLLFTTPRIAWIPITSVTNPIAQNNG